MGTISLSLSKWSPLRKDDTRLGPCGTRNRVRCRKRIRGTGSTTQTQEDRSSSGGTARSGTAEQEIIPPTTKGTWPLCEPRTEREPKNPARKAGFRKEIEPSEGKIKMHRTDVRKDLERMRLDPSKSPNKAKKGCKARRGSAIAGKGENRNLYPAVRPVAVIWHPHALTRSGPERFGMQKELSLREWLPEKQSFRIGPIFL